MQQKATGKTLASTVWTRVNHVAQETGYRYFLHVITEMNVKKNREMKLTGATSYGQSLKITHWMPLHASLSSSRAVRTPSLLQRRWMHGRLMSDSEDVAGGLVAWDQTKVKAVLPSDCPHAVCQGSYLQRKGSADIKGRLPALNPAVTRFPVHLAWGNVCPSHWTDSKTSSKPHLQARRWWEWCFSYMNQRKKDRGKNILWLSLSKQNLLICLGIKYQNVIFLVLHYFATVVMFSYILPWSSPLVLPASPFRAPWGFCHCQPDSTVTGG